MATLDDPTGSMVFTVNSVPGLMVTGSSDMSFTPAPLAPPAAISMVGEEGDVFVLTFNADGLSFNSPPVDLSRVDFPFASVEVVTTPAPTPGQFRLSVTINSNPGARETATFSVLTGLGPFDPSIAIEPPTT